MPIGSLTWAAHFVTAYGAMPCGSPSRVRPSFCWFSNTVGSPAQPAWTLVRLLPIACRKNVSVAAEAGGR